MKWVYRLLGALALLIVALIALAYGSALRGERPVGFQITRATDPGGKPISMGVWYPTTARAWPFAQVGTVLMEVARDAPIAGRRLPLVLISHGNGGGLQSHADLALTLASAGYVVAAPMHAGDNFLDQSAAGSARLFHERNRQLGAALAHLLTSWPGHAAIDAQRIGAFGFSAGGFTVLSAIGAQPDLRQIAAQCAQAPEFVCEVLRHHQSALLNPETAPGEPMSAIAGIRAAVLAAPGLGFTMRAPALAAVSVPVQLWSGERDDRVPYATNAKPIAEGLGPRVELHQVPGASHVSFLAPCGLLRPAELCADPEGFDRKTFHAQMNAEVLKFFDRQLAVGR